MTKYFASCKTLDELKKAYKEAAKKHHPDMGGDTATMQAINAEYDLRFPLLKLAYNKTAAEPTHETAESTRSEFYTRNGWKGERYDISMTTKEIAAEIRKYVKSAYPDCKFSVTTHYASMCSEIAVYLVSGPYEAFRDGKTSSTSLNQYHLTDDDRITDWAKAVMIDVNDCIRSYHFDDCDDMIDYFDVNFYYNIGIGKWDKPYQVIQKQPKIKPAKKAESTQAASADHIRVEFNDEFSGIEVYFPSKPSETVRAALKESGWRWHRAKKCWYNRNSEDNLQTLKAITA